MCKHVSKTNFSVTEGVGGKKVQNMRDVIYEWPPNLIDWLVSIDLRKIKILSIHRGVKIYR